MDRSQLADEVPWRTVLQQVAGPVAIIDRQGRFAYVNPALCRLLGYDAEYLLQRSPREFTHPDDPVVDYEAIERLVAASEQSFEAEKRFLRADGSVIWALVTSSLIQQSEDQPLFFVSQIQDISGRKEAELLWRRTVLHAPIGMALLDMETRFIEVNDTYCEIVGFRRDELLGRPGINLVYNGYRKSVEAVHRNFREGRTETARLEICLRHRDGHPFWMLAHATVIRGADNRPAYVVGQYQSLGDDRKMSQERLAELTRMALHDPLTGLANRALLIDRFEQELAELCVRRGVLAAFLIDLDRFKEVNDHHGHDTGDRVLQIAANELLDCVRPSDTVARTGGDEFVVLAKVANNSQAEALRTRIARRLNATTTTSGHRIRLAASVGLATTRNPSISSRDLLARADRDMYSRKHAL